MSRRNTAGRRGVLGGLAVLAAPTLPAVAGAPTSANPDAALLEACARWMAREAEYEAAYERQCLAEDAGDKAEANRMFKLQCALAQQSVALLAPVIDTPARTAAGRAAKAEVAVTIVQTTPDGKALSREDAMIWSLAEDLAGKPLVPPA